MGVAAHVFDKAPPPPLLTQAFDFQSFGVNILDLPPGTVSGIRAASNAYGAMRGYTSAAGNTVEWTKRNPGAWSFVAEILQERLKQKKECRHAATS